MMGHWTKIGILGLLVMAASAQVASSSRVARRQARQEHRIERGEASGRITGKEAARLERQQDKIAHDKERAMADGEVTRRERTHIRHEQNRASRQIFRKKHNGRWTW